MSTKPVRTFIAALLLLSLGLLAACGSTGGAEATATDTPTSTEPATRIYKDFSGHEVTIPTHPQKIVLLGDIPGDLLALGITPAGNDWVSEPYIYKEDLAGVVDIGYPHNMEKVLELAPDLILQAGYGGPDDTAIFDKMSKIAPTVIFNRDAETFDRLREVADIVNKKEEAEKWIADYEVKAKAMWEKIGLKPGESATVYLSLAGDFYVMGNFSLTMSLYQPGGFSPSAKVQELIDKKEVFSLISMEVLPEYAGDHVFLLSSPGTDDEAAAKKLVEGPLWKSIPAVQNNHAYTADISWNASDPITMERFLSELPKMMGIK
ncbi:ABC transporter substrate-binding protein [Paenibacillus sp. KS-LC4]|uniref:ABC transporter substrate-binding protein n=1 Tax=Paenibacillus sp. KS-LC4 TaxID=2979727 RepID=UPI0030D35F68